MNRTFLRLTLISTGLFFTIAFTSAQNSDTKTEKRIICHEAGNGEKEIKVITIIDGTKTVEVYTGEDADKFIKEHESRSNENSNTRICIKPSTNIEVNQGDNNVEVYKYKIPSKNGDANIRQQIIISDNGKQTILDADEIEKIIQNMATTTVEEVDGKKIIKIVKTKEGKKTVKVYTGEDADIYIQQYDSDPISNDKPSLSEADIEQVVNAIDTELSSISKLQGSQEEIIRAVEEALGNIDGEQEGNKIKKMIIKKNGEDDLTEGLDVEIYPNPSSGEFKVKLNNAEGKSAKISITNLNGKSVYDSKLKVSKDYSKDLNLDLNAGIYMLSVTEGEKTKSKKLIIK